MQNLHISVIDTHRLRPENRILHCGTLEAFGIPPFGEEFLVFGVVSGEAHSAVPREVIAKHLMTTDGKSTIQRFLDPHEYDVFYDLPAADIPQDIKRRRDERIMHALGFSKAFGAESELPMAISLLSANPLNGKVCEDEELQYTLVEILSVPSSWTSHQSFPRLHPTTRGFIREADMASKTVSAIVQKLQKDGRLPSKIQKVPETEGDEAVDSPQSASMVEDDKEQVTAAEGKGKRLARTVRMSKEGYKLYIDMVGYDKHNGSVRQ